MDDDGYEMTTDDGTKVIGETDMSLISLPWTWIRIDWFLIWLIEFSEWSIDWVKITALHIWVQIDWSIEQLRADIDWLTDRIELLHWLSDWLIDRLIDWVIDWSIDWLIDHWLSDWLIDRRIEHWYWLHLCRRSTKPNRTLSGRSLRCGEVEERCQPLKNPVNYHHLVPNANDFRQFQVQGTLEKRGTWGLGFW